MEGTRFNRGTPLFSPGSTEKKAKRLLYSHRLKPYENNAEYR
jgi:hypothetical protein